MSSFIQYAPLSFFLALISVHHLSLVKMSQRAQERRIVPCWLKVSEGHYSFSDHDVRKAAGHRVLGDVQIVFSKQSEIQREGNAMVIHELLERLKF